MDLKEILTASMVLFAVIDIAGSIPIVISLREKAGHIQSEKAFLVAAVIMIAFLFLGEKILTLIGIDVNSFAVAGSSVILFLALEMILGITLFKEEALEVASIVPLAFSRYCRFWNHDQLIVFTGRIRFGQYHYCHTDQHSDCLYYSEILFKIGENFGQTRHQYNSQGFWNRLVGHSGQTLRHQLWKNSDLSTDVYAKVY